MLSTYAQYQGYARDLNASLRHVADEPTVARDTAYYRANIAKVKTVDDFIGNFRLFSYAMKANGLGDAVPNRAFMRKVLTSDLSDAKSFANTLNDGRYKAFALLYNFASSGKVVDTAAAQDTAQQSDTLARFADRTLEGASQSADISYYKAHIGGITSVDALMSDVRLYHIALAAYGIDPDATSSEAIRHALASDGPGSSEGHASTGGDAAGSGETGALAELADAFNFDTGGRVTSPKLAQSAKDTRATLSAYVKQAGSAGSAAAQADAAYYAANIAGVKTLDDFLADPRLVKVATAAFGLQRPAKASDAQWTAQLKGALTSDLADPKSAASKLGTAWRAMAAAFNFASDGTIARGSHQTAQSAKAAVLAADPYIRQALETKAATQNKAVALALAFQRRAPTITSAYDILADKSLLSFVQTAFDLPSSMSTLNIDIQARVITDALKLSDLKDPKKLAAIVATYATRVDVDAAKAASSSPVLMLLGGGAEASSTSVLGIVNPAAQGTDTSSMPVLALFHRG